MEVTMHASFDDEKSSGAQSSGTHQFADSQSNDGPLNRTPVRLTVNSASIFSPPVSRQSNSGPSNRTPVRSTENGASTFSPPVSLQNNAGPLNSTPVRPTENGSPAFSPAAHSNTSPLDCTPVRSRSIQNGASACAEMMWLGYATRLNVKTLKSFQVEALNAYQNSQDVMIIQSTGSGKSLCFQVYLRIIK